MHKVSRTLLLAGVLAFGTLTAACGDTVAVTSIAPFVGVQSVTVSPSNASINVGTSIQLSGSVLADASTAKTLNWTSSNAAVATVDQTGKVTGISGGTVTIVATSSVDASKSGAAAIVVTAPAVVITVPPSISINSVTGPTGLPVNLSATAGQIDITVNTSGGGLIEVFLSTNCTTNTISSTDTPVASQQATSAQAGQVTLSVNTAQLTASNTPRFVNGNYCIKTRLTNGTTQVVATNTTPITLANTSFYRATVSFASQTGGPTSSVSSINGLNYNQGTMTVTLSPVNYNTGSTVALVSGFLTKSGEQGGAAQAAGTNIPFTNIPVTNGVATIVFTDTGSVAGVRSIFTYTSLPAGDSIVVTSATDVAGNSVVATPLVASSIRIDNDFPLLAAAYAITAPNGYLGAAYSLGSGITGAPSDTKAGVPGVGGVTTTWYYGAPGSASFATANSCAVAGLTPATSMADFANTTTTTAYMAKVVVKDALGNSACLDVPSTYAGGTFGVDKIAPEAQFITSAVAGRSGVADLTGYNTAIPPGRGFNLTFRDSISGFPQAAGSSPFTGTVKRNFYNTPSAADCVVGTYTASTTACAPVAISTANVPSWTETTSTTSTFLSGTFEMTNGTAVPGYYTASLTPSDVAGNSSATLVRTGAWDNVAPVVAAPTQSGAVVPLGTVSLSSAATDNLNLTTSRGNLLYALGSGTITFARVAGNTLGTFGQFVTGGTATVALPNVYRGMQDGSSGTISAVVVTPSATISVTDVGTNTTTSGASAVATTTAATAVYAGQTVSLASSATSGSATANATTTNLTFQINGTSADPAFQSQPFPQVDIYKLNTTTGEYALVGSVTAATVTDNTTTGVRTYTYVASGVTLSGGTLSGATAAATNTFIAVGRTAAGDAVRSPSVTQINN